MSNRSCKEEVLTDVCTMVYSYPLAEAIKQGWLKNISFHEVFVEKAHFYRTNVDGEVSPRSTQSSSSSMSSSTPGRAGKQYPEHYYLGTEELDAQRSRPHIYSECKYDPAVRTQVNSPRKSWETGVPPQGKCFELGCNELSLGTQHCLMMSLPSFKARLLMWTVVVMTC